MVPRILRIVVLSLLLGLNPNALVNLRAQSPPDLREYVQKAQTAYKDKDYAALIENMKAALVLRPNWGTYTFYLAKGYALSGNKQEALNWLGHLADLGLVYSIARDSDFASIKDSEEFKNLLARFEHNARPVGSSTIAFTVHEKGLVPEGLAYDPAEKIFYLGSVYKRKIISVTEAGEVKEFSSPVDGLWSVMGMRVDVARRVLWVCTAAHAQMMNFKEAENGISGIFKYDLRTKKLIKKYLLPSQPKPHWLGDLALNANGDVFASDSITPGIYKLDRERDSLEVFLENDAFVNPQGLAFSADEKRMFMADYLKGVFAIEMKSKTVSLLAPASSMTTLGLDGLYYHKGKLVGVQNGVRPNRLVELSLNGEGTKIEQLKVLEANNAVFDEPTLAVLTGDTLFYIANSQWATIDEKGVLAAEDKLRNPIVLKLRL
jgi:hypothetical protein